MAFSACDNLEDKLLESKVYFENAKSTIEVDGNDAISFDLTSRLTSAKDENVEITYEIADESAIKEFNEKNGTTLEPLPGAKLLSNVASIKAGSIYSESVKSALTTHRPSSKARNIFFLSASYHHLVTSSKVPRLHISS